MDENSNPTYTKTRRAVNSFLSVLLLVMMIFPSTTAKSYANPPIVDSTENQLPSNQSIGASQASEQSVSQQDPPTTPENKWKVDLARDSYELSGRDAAEYAPRYTKEMLPVVKCARASVIDADSKNIYGKNAHSRVKIASMTKIMCAIIACELPMETPIPVTAGSAYIPGSTANLMEGDESTIYELLKGLMLPSGNDAAYALAIGCGRVFLEQEGRAEESLNEEACTARFVEKMNERAQALGMEDTLFCNPCGLDDDGFEGEHASSAYDVACMTRAAYEIPAIKEIVAKRNDVMFVTRAGERIEIPLDNTNRLLDMAEEAIGMKTGFTDAAGSCVACVFDDGSGSPLFVSILGADSGDDSFESGLALYKWAASSKMSADPLANLVAAADGDGVLSLGRIGHREWLDKDFGIEVHLPNDVKYSRYAWEEDLTCAIEMETADEAARGSIASGDVFGVVVVYNGYGDTVDQFPICAVDDVAEPGVLEKIWVDAVRFFSSLIGMPITHSDDALRYR